MATETVLRKSIYLKADRKSVWAFLTEPEKLELWFHKPTEPLRDDHEYAMYGRDSGDKLMWGKVSKFSPYDELEYTFCIKPMGEAESTVNWTLREVSGGTQLNLVHTGLPQAADAFGLILALDKGWDDHFNEMRGSLHKD